MIRLLLISLLLVSCGKSAKYGTKPTHTYEIAQELTQYINDFYADALSRGTSLPRSLKVEFAETDPKYSANTIGICYYGGASSPLVRVRPSFWNNNSTSEFQRYALIYHELGHCLLGRPHNGRAVLQGDNPFYFPLSIMYPVLQSQINFGGHVYTPNISPYQFQMNNFDDYVDELFGVSNFVANLGTVLTVYSLTTEESQTGLQFYRMELDGDCSEGKHE